MGRLARKLAVGQQGAGHDQVVLGERDQVAHAVLGRRRLKAGRAGVAGQQVEQADRGHVLVDLLHRLGQHALRARLGLRAP